ncbi:MAG: tetratricopeptide repeat protein [Planctomycetes bacterium]|nr:tetratricopeptide repeat protein [Planctomycetota bacterium]
MTSESSQSEKLARLRAAVEKEPGSAQAHLRLGTALQQAGRLKAAEEVLRRALQLEPGLYEAWVNLGGVLFSLWDFNGCVDANARAAACRPEGVPAHYNKGLGHLYLGQAEDVVACFQRVVELDPRNGGGHYHLAAGLNALGRIIEAKAALDLSRRLGFSPEPALVKAIEEALSRTQGDGVISIEIGKGPDES